MKQKKFLIFAFLLLALLFIVTGCARYKDLPSGSSRQFSGAGFAAFNLADLQKPGMKSAGVGEAAAAESDGTAGPPVAETCYENILEDKDYSSLKRFGYDFLRDYPAARAGEPPADQAGKIIPVPRQYRIGHDDSITLLLGGAVNKKYDLLVDSAGKIDIPGFGPVFVGGMTFDEMSVRVISKITKKTAKVPVDISMNPRNTITVYFRGEVNSLVPHTVGAFATVTEALRLAGGAKETGSLRKIQVRRKGITVAVFDLYELLLKGVKLRDITLMDEDEIIVPPRGPVIGITGSVERPAVYELKENENLETLIVLAGGVLPEAGDLRMQIKRVAGNERKIIYDAREDEIKLKKILPPDIKNGDLVLISPSAQISAVEPSDSAREAPASAPEESKPGEEAVVAQSVPAVSQKYVMLTGEFKRPGRYPLEKGEKLSSVIEKAGGYTGNAYLRGAYFTRESLRQIQQKKLEETAQKITRQLLPDGAQSGKVDFRTQDKGVRERFVEYLQSLQATGRLTVKIAHLRLLKNSAHDIEMESGDELYLPVKNSTVYVVGSVMSEGAHIYDESWDYREYIAAAGGYARGAAEQDVFVIKVDGSTRKLYRGFIQWSDKNTRWEISAFGQKIRQIEAGDVIVVPAAEGAIDWLKPVKDTTALIMNTAVLAGTVLKFW